MSLVGAVALQLGCRIDILTPRHIISALLILLSLWAGSWGDVWLGAVIVELGKLPFYEALLNAYGKSRWEVSLGAVAGLSFLAGLKLAGGKVPGGEMMKLEGSTRLLRCVLFWVIGCFV